MPGSGTVRGTFRAWSRATLVAACLAACAGLLPATAADVPSSANVEWKVIVHPANPNRALTREKLERIYRRRMHFWPDGSPIVALNLPSEDPLRRAFTEQALRASEGDMATYWNRQYFQGNSPPVVLQSSRAVRAYVAATPGAIGYVLAPDVDESVASVEIHDGE